MEHDEISRRDFAGIVAGAAAATAALTVTGRASSPRREAAEVSAPRPSDRLLLFHSRGKVGVVPPSGGPARFLEFDVPGQVSWHVGPRFPDRRRLILMSVEGEKTWEHTVRSHLWIYDTADKSLKEIADKNPPAVYMPACALLPGAERMVVNPIINGEQQVMTMNLDGSDQVAVTQPGSGFTYGVSLSPDARRLAFHATDSKGYRVFTVNLDGSGRTLVAGLAEHLYFGPTWSHDGEWLLYVDCHSAGGPGHDWADLCIGRPDASEHRVVTEGQRHWFGTSYGSPATRGSGSNMPTWSPKDLTCTYTRTLPDSRTAWAYSEGRPDTDHFNRDYHPEEARGGTEICIFDPLGKKVKPITSSNPPLWDFRATWSPEGDRIAFCRCGVGCAAELWVMNADGSGQCFLTRGFDDLGADHPAWL